MSQFKEGAIVSLVGKRGMFVIEEAPLVTGRLYVLHDYNSRYKLIYAKEEDILPIIPTSCFHYWKTIDVGLYAKNEIRYCENCGLKFEDLERTKNNEKK